MASRTNKRWIAAKKEQQKKQSSRLKWEKKFNYPKRKISLEDAKSLSVVGSKTNPQGRDYHWFLKGRKVCWETGLRVDPDGFRLIKLSSGGFEFVEVPFSGWVRKKLTKRKKNMI